MSIEIKEDIKEKVLSFIETQPGYNSDEVEEVIIHYKNNLWSILYGKNIEVGITGMGDTPEFAFDDFIAKWRAFKGFEWIKKTNNISSNSL